MAHYRWPAMAYCHLPALEAALTVTVSGQALAPLWGIPSRERSLFRQPRIHSRFVVRRVVGGWVRGVVTSLGVPYLFFF